MPWCPICKNEYREGISECSECKVPLVESLDDIVEEADELLFSTDNLELADKFITYLDYSDIKTHKTEHNDDNGMTSVYVTHSDLETAKKLFRGFSITENDLKTAKDTAKADEELPETDKDDDKEEYTEPNLRVSDSGGAFVKKADQYQDYRFSALSCLIVGLAGIVFCIFNILGMINIISALFSQMVMMCVFILFVAGGIALYIKSGSIKQQIDSETSVIDSVNEWLKDNITIDYINSIKDENVSDEINYFNYVDDAKERMLANFPDIDIKMAEALIDEHINNIL